MASIQRIVSPLTKDVSYRAQVRVKGRPPESKTFTSRKDAKEWGATLESAITAARYFPSRKAQRTFFAELVERYRRDAQRDPSRGAHLDWWKKRFLGLTIAEITTDKVAEARDALMAETFTRAKPRIIKGAKVPPKQYNRTGATVNRYLATLGHFFTTAVKEWRLLDRNPVRDVSKKKEARGRVRFLSDPERDALLGACEQSDWPALYTLVLMAISTGARRGELVNLKWTDVDLKAARAIVHETKNGDPRVLPLVGRTLTSLRELKLQGSAQSEWVFQQPSGLPGPYEGFDAHWYAALKSAGIQNFKFHDLRHSCASYLAAGGASLLEIADTLGHRTIAMSKRYSHLTQTHKVAAIEKMAREKGL